MSTIDATEDFALEELPKSLKGLNLSTQEQAQVAAWVDRFGDKLLSKVKEAGLLTVLDEAVMENSATASPTAVAMTPARRLDVASENIHLDKLASDTADLLKTPSYKEQIRSIFVYLLREGLKRFTEKECVPGTELTREKIHDLLRRHKRAFDKNVKNGNGAKNGQPQAVLIGEQKAQAALNIMREIMPTKIPDKIMADDSEMRDQIIRALQHSRTLYKEIGDELFRQGPRIAEMYKLLTGDATLQLPKANPMTALNNDTVGSQSFTDLAWYLLEGLDDKKIAEKSKEDLKELYHAQVILWLTLMFFQIDLQPAAAKAEITELVSRSTTDFITKKLQGKKLIHKNEQIDGREEPVVYREIHINGRTYQSYSGEPPISKKRRYSALLKEMRKKTKDKHFILVDEERGELMINQNSETFTKGANVVTDAETLLKDLASHLGLTIIEDADGKYDYESLKPGEAVIKKKLGNKGNPSSFDFAAVKLYGHLQFCETKRGRIFLQDTPEMKEWAKKEGLEIHTARFEYRVVPKDTWIKAHYNQHHPSYQDYYRLRQIIAIAKFMVRPAENPELYEYMAVVEKMLIACEKKLKASSPNSPSPAEQEPQA